MVAVLFALGLLAATFAAKRGSAHVTDGTLAAAVGPGFTISLTQNGSSVTSLAPGTYTIDVSDQATVHNFHLSGPGVDQATSITGTGSATWTVTLSGGSYHYQCDMHPTMLHGDFTVGQAVTTTTTPTTTSTPPPTTTTVPPTTTAPTTTTTAPPVTTTAPSTVGTTTGATVTTTATTTTLTATPASVVSAQISKVTATRSRITLTVTLDRRARITAELFARHGVRVARTVATADRIAHIALRPAHRLAPGRYVLRVRVAAGGRSVVKTRAVRVASSL